MAEATDTSYRFGIEEEFFLADVATRGTPDGAAARAFHKTVAEKIRAAGRENLQSQVEIQTPPADRAVQALEGLVGARAKLKSLAHEQGLVVFAAGTHPNSRWSDQDRSEGERYEGMAADYGILASRNMVCALHVHVELTDPSRRALLMRRMVPYVPLFLALSASSPFWECRDTGLKSYRMAAYQEWPRSGLPDLMEDEADYARYLSVMVRAGAIPDESYLWWAIRPSGKFPTLELRVCDSCASVADSVAIASLYRCVVRMLERRNEVHAGLTGGSRAIASENLWRVQRHGAAATVIDEASAKMSPVAVQLDGLTALVEQDAEALGCLEALDTVRAIVRRGTGADQQRAIWRQAREAGQDDGHALAAVVDMLADATASKDIAGMQYLRHSAPP
jgi:glutamate---cysteine ligase / carboxylate-amine ligase